MRLEHDFSVAAPLERVWDLLLDVPLVVPCMPGAELLETVDGERWKAKLSVKLGPVQLVFAADVERELVDPGARRVVLVTRAREVRGRGGAQARIESSLAPEGGGTRVELVTDVALSGAAAQFGSAVVQDVSRQLVARFAACLEQRFEAPSSSTESAAGAEPARAEPSAAPVAGLRLVLPAMLRTLARRLRLRR